MTRKEALKIGKIIANRWWRYNEPFIRSRQHIERMKQKSDPADQSIGSQTN
jgi:hypothetical protein